MVRKLLSKKTRFEVFKRDSFCCQYCHSKPPKVPIEIDHIIPVSRGGTNDIDNLITACFDCNRGKSDNELTSIPENLENKLELKKAAFNQYKEFEKILKKEAKQRENDVNEIEDLFSSVFQGKGFTKRFRVSVKIFIGKLNKTQVIEAMEKSIFKISNPEYALNYFCAICWNKIKER